MSFLSSGGKFKVYTVLNGLIFPTPTQPGISFERAIDSSFVTEFPESFKTEFIHQLKDFEKLFTERRRLEGK
jgi:hypothetical protein